MKEEQEQNKKTIEEQMQSFLDGFEERLKAERESNAELTDKKIAEQVAAVKEEAQAMVDRIRANNVNLPGMEEKKEREKFSFAKACNAIINQNWEKAGYEKEVFEETRKKAVDTNTGAQGGFLIPLELSAEILEPAIAAQVMVQAGMQVWPNMTADVDIRELTSRPTLTWLTDGQSLTAQNISHARKSLRPKEAGMLIEISNRLLMQAPGEQLVRKMMIEGATDGLDIKAFSGSGTDSEPLGLINAGITNTASVGGGGGRLVVDKVASMIADVEDSNYGKMPNSLSFVTKPRVLSGLKRERIAQYSGDTSGQPLINPLMTNEVLKDILGLKYIGGTTNVPVVSTGSTLTYGVVGEFDQFVQAIWGGLRLKSSDTAGTAFASNQTWIVAFVDVDTQILHEKAFCLLSDAESNEASW